VLRVGFAVRAPSVSKKIAPGDRNKSCIGRGIVTVRARSGERGFHDMTDALFYGQVFGSVVPRIFSPKSTDPCFHRVASGDSGETNSVALGKPIPVRSVFSRRV